MRNIFLAAALAAASCWSGMSASQPLADSAQARLYGEWHFPSAGYSQLKLGLRLEQPPQLAQRLGFLRALRPAAQSPLLPALAQWEWRAGEQEFSVDGVRLGAKPGAGALHQTEAAADSGGFSTTTWIAAGAAAVALAVAAGGHGGGNSGSSGGSGGPYCGSDSFHQCDGVPSGVCGAPPSQRFDDDGDCSTTYDTLGPA